MQAGSRDDLREKLHVVSGGVVFTTIQKFIADGQGTKHPALSERRNIIVMADDGFDAPSLHTMYGGGLH